VVRFTYGGTVNPDLILSGWNGSAVGVTVRIYDNGSDDWLAVRNASTGSILVGLGGVDLHGNHANGASVDFTGSQMTLSGNTVTVVLGTRSGPALRDMTAKAMTWWTFQGNTTESGALDADF
jgi:hypothetical protein